MYGSLISIDCSLFRQSPSVSIAFLYYRTFYHGGRYIFITPVQTFWQVNYRQVGRMIWSLCSPKISSKVKNLQLSCTTSRETLLIIMFLLFYKKKWLPHFIEGFSPISRSPKLHRCCSCHFTHETFHIITQLLVPKSLLCFWRWGRGSKQAAAFVNYSSVVFFFWLQGQ